jgi:hypothetical protein
VVLSYYLCSCGESHLLVSWCAGSRCDIAGSDEDRGRSRRPGAEDRGWSAQVGYSVAERSGDRVMSCAICTMHIEMRSMDFLVEPQNQGRRFSGLGLKTSSSGLVIWASKSPRWFLGLGLKTKWATVCQLRHKTDGRIIRSGACVEIWRLASLGSKSR